MDSKVPDLAFQVDVWCVSRVCWFVCVSQLKYVMRMAVCLEGGQRQMKCASLEPGMIAFGSQTHPLVQEWWSFELLEHQAQDMYLLKQQRCFLDSTS